MRFSALQRAEIAEIKGARFPALASEAVSVLFNEPKLLKSRRKRCPMPMIDASFSALQRAEIAEIRSRAPED